MSVNFFESKCISKTNKELFGLCDDPPPPENPAYIDETDGSKWIAVVVNDNKYSVTFIAVDHCVDTIRPDGTMDNRCDGMLLYNTTVIFVELKEQNTDKKGWIISGETQLKTSIKYFESSKLHDTTIYTAKKAYIANRLRPRFRSSQQVRMDKFSHETGGYILRIENRITLE